MSAGQFTESFDANLEPLLHALREASRRPGFEDAWPSDSLRLLRDHGVFGWSIPVEYGGSEFSGSEMVHGYRRLAAACLTTTFVLTQQNAACQRIAGCDNDGLKSAVLPALAMGDVSATVGISHLSTSRQHLDQPAVSAEPAGDGYVLRGTIPWVTGAAHADRILVGATCPDGLQILALVDGTAAGVEAGTAAEMLSMTGSATGSIELTDVRVASEAVVAGPTEAVMKTSGGVGAGSVTTSALALGAAEGAIGELETESTGRLDVRSAAVSLREESDELGSSLLRFAEIGEDAGVTAQTLRERANSLVLRSSQALLTATKGAGFVRGHSAERRVREAAFFLVWSCPQPVARTALLSFARAD